MSNEFKEIMQSKSRYFVCWQETYDEQVCCYEYYKYVKDDYSIFVGMTSLGWTPGLLVDKNGKDIIKIERGKCVLIKGVNKNNIKKRVKDAYKEKRNKATGFYDANRNKRLIDVYIEFLVENGILTESQKLTSI